MNNLLQQEGNCQNMNNQETEKLSAYLSGFDNTEKARAFLDDILIWHNDEQWAVGGLITMLDTIATQKSLEDVKSYIAKLQTHLLSDWTTAEMPDKVKAVQQSNKK
jgi:hypothetical protein